eukprot:gene462-554_t
MLETQENNHLIRWGRLGESIVITNCAEFETKLLPKYFKTGKFCSFIRQLNIYGFHKVDDEKSAQNEEIDHETSESQARIFEFANDYFKKQQPDIMVNIKRRKSVRRALTVNNNNPNAYRTGQQPTGSTFYAEDDDDESVPYYPNVTIPSTSSPVVISTTSSNNSNGSNHNNGINNLANNNTTLPNNSSHSTPVQSPSSDIKPNAEQFDPSNVLQQLIYQFTKSQTDHNELKYSHQQLQDSHSQLQFAFQNLQQSHQNLLERVLKLTKAILDNTQHIPFYLQQNTYVKEEVPTLDETNKDLQSFLLEQEMLLHQSSQDFMNKRNKSIDGGLTISQTLMPNTPSTDAFFTSSNQSNDATKLNQAISMDFGLYY